jgi:hypothetical protein
VRVAHYLKGNKGGELPHQAVYLDTETDPHRLPGGETAHRLRFGWACFERTRESGSWCEPEWFRFTSPADLWTWLEQRSRPRTRLYVFAHNWSFDGPVCGVFSVPLSRGWELKRAIIEGPPVILTYRRGTSTIELLDTLNWWRMPLASIGESVGIPKLRMPPKRASRSEWDIYCRRDVEVIRAALHAWWRFLDAHDLGGFARTLAGQALRSYRHRFMDSPILIDDDARALALARESYHGGRTECFRLGKVQGPITCLDVNSMYPAVMRDGSFPAALVRFTRRASVSDLALWSLKHSVVARVMLKTDRNRFAVVDRGKLVFPVGRFWAALTKPEIHDALDHGEIQRVDCVSLYDEAPLFARFVTELYQLRHDASSRGDSVSAWLLKILMNSLYGKFGQRGGVWESAGQARDETVRCWIEYDVVEGTLREWRQFAGHLQTRSGDAESRDSSPAIASTVTALARQHLAQLIETASPSETVYCDTDSLYVLPAGAKRLAPFIDPARLGALKVERVLPWIVLHGPKDYETPDGPTIKGVRASARWTSTSTVEQEQWTGLKGLLQRGDMSAPITKLIEKHLRREYTKGTADRHGRISPLRLDAPDLS